MTDWEVNRSRNMKRSRFFTDPSFLLAIKFVLSRATRFMDSDTGVKLVSAFPSYRCKWFKKD
jgi:hypothetical protein